MTARNGGRGFTLIELLLVMVILVILASIIIPQVTQHGDRARITKAKADISMLETAVSTFQIHCGRYPTNDEGLEVLVRNPGDESWGGPYIKLLSPDPWGTPYIYEAPGEHLPASFDLYSLGKDRTESEDDVVNWKI